MSVKPETRAPARRPEGRSASATRSKERVAPSTPGRPAKANTAGTTSQRARPIRPARSSDLAAILALEEACFEPYRRASAASLRRSLKSPRQSVWVVDGPGQLHGLLVLWHLPKAVRIYDIATHPDARGQGLGRHLMGRAHRLAKNEGAARMLLEAEEQDPRLVGWYESQGFAVQARFRDYYHTGCSALRLSKDL